MSSSAEQAQPPPPRRRSREGGVAWDGSGNSYDDFGEREGLPAGGGYARAGSLHNDGFGDNSQFVVRGAAARRLDPLKDQIRRFLVVEQGAEKKRKKDT